MPNLEIMPYQRVDKPPKEQRKWHLPKGKFPLSLYDTIQCGIGFLFARAIPFAGLSPFGVSFLAQERTFSTKTLVSMIAICLGSLLLPEQLTAAKYISATLLYTMFLFVLEREKSLSVMQAATAAGIALFLPGIVLMNWAGYTAANVFLLIVESLICSLGVVIFDKSRTAGKEKRIFSAALDTEEKISLYIMLGIALLSLKELQIGTLFSFSNFAALSVLLTIAISCGAGYAAATGSILGILCGIGSDDILTMMGIFTLCGFVCGLLSRYGKSGTAIGMLLTNAAIVIYTDAAASTILSLYEVFASIAVVMCLPRRFFRHTAKLAVSDTAQNESSETVRKNIKAKLSAVSSSFEHLSEAFTQISDSTVATDWSDIAALFDTTADRVCRTCKNSMICWGRDFNSTYQTMFKCLEVMEQKGKLEESDVSDYFRRKCVKLKPIVTELNKLFEVYTLNRVWKNRLVENRELVGEQLMGVSRIMDKMIGEVDAGINYDTPSAEELRTRLDLKGIRAKDVTVFQDTDGKLHAELSVKRGTEDEVCAAVIRPAVKAALGCSVGPHKMIGRQGMHWRIRFDQSEVFQVDTGFASKGAAEECGDNHMCYRLDEGKFVIALSDGMGTGRRAAKDSKAIVQLLGDFLKAGFEKGVAVRLINSIMVMKSAREIFATIDMCIIDLFTGEVEFIKTGAEPSYILHENGVESVRAASLPVGVLSKVEVESFARQLKTGDRIVMITDGIERKDSGDAWVRAYLDHAPETIPPSTLAHDILNRAAKQVSSDEADDMTVIVAEIQ